MEKLFFSSWQDYEECSSVEVFYFDSKYYARYFGHNVYCGDYDNTEEILENEAMEILEEWNCHEIEWTL